MLLVGFAIGACRKKNDFVGSDSYVTSFSLKKGGTTFPAAITDTSIIITAPVGISLDSAAVSFSLSENATIYPKPDSITQWNTEYTFIVNAYNGFRKAYKYTVQRTSVAVNSSVTLATQADVDAFAKTGATEINGNLVIGKTTGADSITNLNGLFNLRTVGYSLIIYPTYSGHDLTGLDNLQSVGTLEIEGVNNLVSLNLPALQRATSITVSNPLTESIAFPKLTTVDQTINVDAPLNNLSLPNLATVGGQLTMKSSLDSSSPLIQVFAFPMLKTVGSIDIERFKQATKIDLPVLTTTGDLYLDSLTALSDLNAPVLKTASGTITIPEPTKLAQLVFPTLATIGGDFTLATGSNSRSIAFLSFPVLQSVGGQLKVYASQDFSARNTKLTDLDGFSALATAQSVYVTGQSALDSFRGLQKVIPSLSFISFLAFSNDYNPSYDDLAAGQWIKP